MKHINNICMLFPAILLASCSSGIPGYRPLTYSNDSEARVFLSQDQCMHTPQLKSEEMAPIVSAIAIQGVELLFSKFSTALKNGTAAGNLPASTSSINFEPSPGRVPSCILVVRGEFADGAPANGTTQLIEELQDPYTEAELATMQSAKYRQQKEKANETTTVENGTTSKTAFQQPKTFIDNAEKLEWASINSTRSKEVRRYEIARRYHNFMIPVEAARVKSIDHIFEIQILGSSNQYYLSLAPVFAQVNRSIDDDKRGKRSFVVSIEFITKTLSATNVSSELKTGAILLLDNLRIGERKVYSSTNTSKLRLPKETGWFPAFNGKQGNIEEDSIDPLSNLVQSSDKEAVAMTLTAKVVEARPTKEGRAFVSEIFEGVKDAAKQTATAKLQTTAQIKAAELKQLEADLNTTGQKEDAINFAVEKFSDYCEAISGEGNSVNSSGLLVKIKAANNASNALAKISNPSDPPIFGAKFDPSTRADNPVNMEICRRVALDRR